MLAESPKLARFQRRIDKVWPALAGGCHTGRDTPRAISDAGFDIVHLRRFGFAPCLLAKPVAPHILAVATRPTSS